MALPSAALALEFDVLVKRACRHGRLALDELTDTYTALHPQSPDAGDRVDLPRLVAALASLPKELCDARELLLVPDIRGFSHTPWVGDAFVCGRMADGTWLGDLSRGYADLVRWVSCLCEVNRARRQALRLAAAHADVVAGGDLGHVAFAWGCDEATLQEAVNRCGNTLLRVLHPDGTLPAVTVHAASHPASVMRQHERDATRVVGAVAEMGLVDRPIHLWLGEGRIGDCLSPYSRELRDVLWHWAQNHPDRVGSDVPAQPGDDALYAVCHDFLAGDARLVGEKEEADRTQGIYTSAIGRLLLEMVDLGRVDPTVCDPRLPRFVRQATAPALVRVDATDTQLLQATLEAFINTLGSRLASITVALPTQAPLTMAGEITLPRFAVNWAGGQKLPVPGEALTPRDFAGLVDRPVQSGDTLLVPALGQHTPGALELMAEDPAIACVQLGSVDMVAAMHDAMWSGKLADRIECAWVAVPLAAAATGRPTLGCLRSLSAVALARLRRIVAAPAAPAPMPQAPAPQPPTPPRAADEPARRAAWSMRIKA